MRVLYKNKLNLLYFISILAVYACNTTEKGEKKSYKVENNKQDNLEVKKKVSKKKVEVREFILDSTKNTKMGCQFESSMQAQGLVDIKEIDLNILVDLRYSSTDNFVGRDVYGCLSTCYLQPKTAKMLAKASQILRNEYDSLRLLVYDGARPHVIQKKLWESLAQLPPQRRKIFVADPSEGSIHNYGSAVDLTIALADGKPLDMGTKYDFFGELAYPKFEHKFLAEGKLSQTQFKNRQLLRKVMQAAGFMPIEYEWWHFNAVSRSKAKLLYKIIQ
jgi:zinc D-Ala-D-Ala dipeptidase